MATIIQGFEVLTKPKDTSIESFPIFITVAAGAGQTTLPIWIFQNLFRPNQAPIVNVVAAALIVVSIIPIYLSQRLTQERK